MTVYVTEPLPGMPDEPERHLSDPLLRGWVLRECKERGLLAVSLTYGQLKEPGWPDFIILGTGGKTVFAEMKQENGSLSWSQRVKARELRQLGFVYRTWRPSDWWSGSIRRELDILAGLSGEEAA